MKEMNQKMGTHKFKFSDIMPHTWLYKLKGISRSTRKHFPSSPKRLSSSDASSSRKILRLSSPVRYPQASSSSSPSNSSFKRKIKRKTVYKPSSKLKLSSFSLNSHVSLTTSRHHRSKSSSSSSSTNAIILEPSFNSHASENHSSADTISDSAVGSSANLVSSPSDQYNGLSRDPETYQFDIKDEIYVRKLDDIPEDHSLSGNSSPVLSETVKEPPLETRIHQKLKKQSAGSSGIRIRANSPRIARKKKTKRRTSPESKKKGIAESFAIVLTSMDPERDFRDSMIEMIVENKIKEQKDLEDLLACYLSLNSSEYHHIIIKAFEKTWFHLTLLT